MVGKSLSRASVYRSVEWKDVLRSGLSDFHITLLTPLAGLSVSPLVSLPASVPSTQIELPPAPTVISSEFPAPIPPVNSG